MDKKTKIVCTIGPASESPDMLENLMLAGMNVCRLNMSHGNHQEHQERINNITKIREKLDLPVAIMLDTKGPEIRLGDFESGQIDLSFGDKFTLTTRDILGNQDIVSVSYSGLAEDVVPGDRILIDDGLVELWVEEVVDGTDIITQARNFGQLKDKKGVNVPSVLINLPSMTQRDVDDIIFGIENSIDFVAPSFIRKAEDVLEIRKVLEENGGSEIGIISKIENQEGIENLEEIIEASDGIMVARGDLGVEIATELMPMVQKDIIRRCNLRAKPVITATQMLESMTLNPRPTRAEVTDIANAILDGTDAVMLSGETAVGKYPLESVETMVKIAINTENSQDFIEKMEKREGWPESSTTNSISRSSCKIAQQLGARAILTATASGGTARQVSKFRPDISIVAATFTPKVMRRLSLVWGVHPVLSQRTEDTDQVIEASIVAAMDQGWIDQGDLIVITAGIPVAVKGSTNLIKVHTVGDVLARGTGIGLRSVSGRVRKVFPDTDLSSFREGEILVGPFTDRDTVPILERARAVVVEEGGLTSHAAIVALNFGLPAIVGVEGILDIVEDGDTITIDPRTGIIYQGEARVL